MTIFLTAFFGLCIGSFLNVCIYRVPRKLSVRFPRRSYCPHCSNTLTWIENIPVLSWVFLRGKCRYCKKPISGQYPLVEILSAAGAVETYLKFGLTPTAAVVYVLVATLIVITFIDLEFKIIPNVISYPGMSVGLVLGIVSQYFVDFSEPITQSALDSLLGFVVGGGFFYLLSIGYFYLAKQVGLGGGDVKLLAMIGAILGLSAVFPTIFLGSFLGAIVGLVTMVFKGGGRHSEIPFGPWLSLGALLHIFTDISLFRFF